MKTASTTGHGFRTCPIFPELKPFLEAFRAEAADDSGFVITTYRESNINLRTQLERIAAMADVPVWPKLFINLRASCATDLVRVHPSHVATAWLGHSEAIANANYRQVTEDDFAAACATPRARRSNRRQTAAHR